MTCLRAAGNDVVRADSPTAAMEVIAARAVDLALVHYCGDEGFGDIVSTAYGRIPLVVLSTELEPSAAMKLVCDYDVQHLLARNTGADHSLAAIDTREVVVTCEKILQGDLFGVDKYLPTFAVDLTSFDVEQSSDRDVIVECVDDYLKWLGVSRNVRTAMALIADELTTNAIYNAPRAADGTARYAALDRREKIDLDPWEHARVQFGSDGDVFVLSVTDFFGALEPQRILDGMRRCLASDDQIEHKAGGAGIGLYTALGSCAQLVFNVEPGVRTEVIAIADLSRGAPRKSSLHLFTSAELRRSAGVPDAVESVAVSDTMRHDLKQLLTERKAEPAVIQLKTRRCTTDEANRAPTEERHAHPTASPIGFDTARGLIRGASSGLVAVEAGLGFLINQYTSAIAYIADAETRTLRPWFGAGEIDDWRHLLQTRIRLDDPCSVAVLTSNNEVAAFHPTYAFDYRIAKLLCGRSEAPGVVVPVTVDEATSYVLYGAGPRSIEANPVDNFGALRFEIESSLVRLRTAGEEPDMIISVSA